MQNKTAIIIHHSADAGPDPQYQKVWNYHNSGAGGKWPKGYGIQYTWFIGKSGDMKQGRPEDSIGWQAGSTHWNAIGIGICLAGDFTQENPTDAQIMSLTALVTDIQNRWGIQDKDIYLHKEVRPQPTACPGVDLREMVFVKRSAIEHNQMQILIEAIPHLTGARLSLAQRVLQNLQNIMYGKNCPC